MATDALTDELQAFVGKNADYYLERWKERLLLPGAAAGAEQEGPGQGIRKFHWPAFFFGLMWLFYRKMYRPAAIVMAIFAAEEIVETFIFVGWLGYEEAPGLVVSIFALIVGVALGGYANVLYLKSAEDAITAARAEYQDHTQRLEQLRTRGRTSVAAILVGGIVSTFLVVLVYLLSLIVLDLVMPAG